MDTIKKLCISHAKTYGVNFENISEHQKDVIMKDVTILLKFRLLEMLDILEEVINTQEDISYFSDKFDDDEIFN